MTLLVTGSAGFIGANFVIDWFSHGDEPIISLDRLSYAGHLENLKALEGNPRHCFVKGDIGDSALVGRLLAEHSIRAVVNFAAESHVDRSISGPAAFIDTNVQGFGRLLEAARRYQAGLTGERAAHFRFVQISTDEVFGSLLPQQPAFVEDSPYRPNSPYSASKAAADHLLRAYQQTYGLPTLLLRSSNNYGPYQYPEKLIPLVIQQALAGAPLPIYGDGHQVRDWLHVSDHCAAIALVLAQGQVGQSYNAGGGNQWANIELVRRLCQLLDQRLPRADGGSYAQQIQFVADRPGHDRRYAMDSSKLQRELGWQPRHSLGSGLEQTLDWYLQNQDWVAAVTGEGYQNWLSRQYS